MTEDRIADREGRCSAAVERIGRDELNFAEFPLSTLADRDPAGKKSLVFERPVRGRRSNRDVRKRLTISASAEYGLPTALDDEVILGLIQVTRAADFSSRTVFFSRYELIRLLGWPDGGKSYRRLEKSLKLWLGVTLYYENAWWDKQATAWVDEHFHVLDNVVLYGNSRKRRNGVLAAAETRRSSFTWNAVVFRSFEAGNLKPLDMDLYRNLKLPTAKRMYRFLDKRFWHSSRLVFDLRDFAHERLGLSRCDVAQLKRRLKAPILELEQVGFLVPTEQCDRFHRVCRGKWEIKFVAARKDDRKKRKTGCRDGSPLESELIERGVSWATAVHLVREHSADVIREKINAVDALKKCSGRNALENPPGFLVKSIKDNYQFPPSLLTKQRKPEATSSGNAGSCRRAKSAKSISPEEKARSDTEQKQIDAYLADLSAEDRNIFEEEALRQAEPAVAAWYRRCQESPHGRSSERYRQMILEHHARVVLGLPPE